MVLWTFMLQSNCTISSKAARLCCFFSFVSNRGFSINVKLPLVSTDLCLLLLCYVYSIFTSCEELKLTMGDLCRKVRWLKKKKQTNMTCELTGCKADRRTQESDSDLIWKHLIWFFHVTSHQTGILLVATWMDLGHFSCNANITKATVSEVPHLLMKTQRKKKHKVDLKVTWPSTLKLVSGCRELLNREGCSARISSLIIVE